MLDDLIIGSFVTSSAAADDPFPTAESRTATRSRTSTQVPQRTSTSSTLSPSRTQEPQRTSTSSTLSPSRIQAAQTTSAASTSIAGQQSATTLAGPAPASNSFRMTAGAIAATVVLCCFFFGGIAIMLYLRIRRNPESRKRRQAPSSDSHGYYGGGSKYLGDSLAPSRTIARESIMYHPEHTKSNSTATLVKNGWDMSVAEQEFSYDYRTGRTDIPLSEMERSEEAGKSPLAPLLSLHLPRPLSNVSQRGERPSLQRQFSFDNVEEGARIPSQEPSLNRRSALSDNPSTDWPLAAPSYYSAVPASEPYQQGQEAWCDKV